MLKGSVSKLKLKERHLHFWWPNILQAHVTPACTLFLAREAELISTTYLFILVQAKGTDLNPSTLFSEASSVSLRDLPAMEQDADAILRKAARLQCELGLVRDRLAEVRSKRSEWLQSKVALDKMKGGADSSVLLIVGVTAGTGASGHAAALRSVAEAGAAEQSSVTGNREAAVIAGGGDLCRVTAAVAKKTAASELEALSKQLEELERQEEALTLQGDGLPDWAMRATAQLEA